MMHGPINIRFKLLFFENKGFVINTDFGCTDTVEAMEAWRKAWYLCVHVEFFFKISAVLKHRRFTSHTKNGLKVAGRRCNMTRFTIGVSIWSKTQQA